MSVAYVDTFCSHTAKQRTRTVMTLHFLPPAIDPYTAALNRTSGPNDRGTSAVQICCTTLLCASALASM